MPPLSVELREMTTPRDDAEMMMPPARQNMRDAARHERAIRQSDDAAMRI